MCEQEQFMKAQIMKIEKDKWYKGEEQHSDPGEQFVIDWVHRNAKDFRDHWDVSVCRTCNSCRQCGFNAISACDNYVCNSSTSGVN